MSVQVTSFMPSGNASVTRTREQLVFPFPARPQAMTGYARFIHLTNDPNSSRRIWQIGVSTGLGPRLAVLFGPGRRFNALYQNTVSGAAQFTVVLTSPAIGDLVECRLALSAVGLVTIGVSINGAAEVTATGAGPLTLPQLWSAQQLWINSQGIGNVGSNVYLNLLFLAGVQSLATMQRRAGTFQR